MNFDPERDREGEKHTLNSNILQRIYSKEFEGTNRKKDLGGVDIESLDRLIGIYDRTRFRNDQGIIYPDITFNVWESDNLKSKRYGSLKKAYQNSQKYDQFIVALAYNNGSSRLRWGDPNARDLERFLVDLKAIFQDVKKSGQRLSEFGFDDRHAKRSSFIYLPKSVWQRYIVHHEVYR